MARSGAVPVLGPFKASRTFATSFWAGSRGPTQWVQYTFPGDETVAKAEVFWTTPPQSWRLLYQDGAQWKEVAVRGGYGVTPNAFKEKVAKVLDWIVKKKTPRTA